MSARAALLRAVLANPDDDTPRLALADWLDEYGDSDDRGRAEFVRVQCELARLPPRSRRRGPLERRQGALLTEVGQRLSRSELVRDRHPAGRCDDDAFHPYVGELTWHRGFPRWVLFSAENLLDELSAVFEAEAVFESALAFNSDDDGAPEWLTSLCDSPLLAHVAVLELLSVAGDGGRSPRNFVRLFASPHLTNLRHVHVQNTPVGLAGVRALFASPSEFSLRSLVLSEVIDDGHVEADRAADYLSAVKLAAGSPRLMGLEVLELDAGRDAPGRGEEVADILLASKTLPKTTRLRLVSNPPVPAHTRARLAERFRLARADG